MKIGEPGTSPCTCLNNIIPSLLRRCAPSGFPSHRLLGGADAGLSVQSLHHHGSPTPPFTASNQTTIPMCNPLNPSSNTEVHLAPDFLASSYLSWRSISATQPSTPAQCPDSLELKPTQGWWRSEWQQMRALKLCSVISGA
jgi:hypothetical protein